MAEISLFIVFASFYFFMLPTVKRQLSAMQDSDYFFEKYIVFMKGQRKIESMWVMVAFIITSLSLQKYLPVSIYLLLHAAVLLILGLLHLRKPAPKSPRREPRMVKLCFAAGFLFLAIFLMLGILFSSTGTFFYEMPFILMFLGFMTDTWILLGNWLVQPGEKKNEKRRTKAALAKMQTCAAEREKAGKKPLVVVGVAGTFGKTGFIETAVQLLDKEYRVLSSDPAHIGSIGNAAALIEKELTPEHDVLLLEIMCRHPGDVEAFVKAIPVTAGVLTSAAERNLETFLSPERIASTLAEIAVGLKDENGGKLFLNYDDEQIRKLKFDGLTPVRYGSYRGDVLPQHLDIWAKNCRYTVGESAFELTDHRGLSLDCRVPSTGKYASLAAIAAAALGLNLGLGAEKVRAALSGLTGITGYPRLLEAGAWPDRIRKKLAKPWETDGAETREKAPYRILDDPNELSLDGARDTLSVLGEKSGCRILLTHGLHGQGEREDECNRLLGRQAAKCCDAIIVVGREKFILMEDGAQRQGFAMGDMHLATDLKDAIARAASLAADADQPVCMLTLGDF